MNNNFEQELYDVRQKAAAEFDERNQGREEDAAYRRDRNAHCNDAAERWFAEQPRFASIVVRESRGGCEVQDRWFNGTIHVYRPRRDYDWDGDKRIVKIAPGYVSGSSWEAGNHTATAASVRQEMEHRLRMMEIAVERLNEFNQLLVEWDDVENPEHVREQRDRYRESERQRVAAEAERKNKKSK